jgi:hypothetical protein
LREASRGEAIGQQADSCKNEMVLSGVVEEGKRVINYEGMAMRNESV